MSKRSAPTLATEKSFDSVTGMPTGSGSAAAAHGGFAGGRSKFFKLDRTYSDVVEDELYAPHVEAASTAPGAARGEKRPGLTRSLQSLYPDIFSGNRPSSEKQSGIRSSLSREQTMEEDHDADRRNYAMGMESSVRLDARPNKPELAIADKRYQTESKPEAPTVSPKEAFLDYPDGSSYDDRKSVFTDRSGAGPSLYSQHSASGIAPVPSKLRQQSSSASENGFNNFGPSLSQGSATQEDMAPPYAIPRAGSSGRPKAANGHALPTGRDYRSLYTAGVGPYIVGPTREQQQQNAAANARYRKIQKEDSAVSIATNSSAVSTDLASSQPIPDDYPHALVASGAKPKAGGRAVPSTLRDESTGSDETANSKTTNKATPRRKAQNGSAGQTPVADDEASSASKKLAQAGPHKCMYLNASTGELCGVEFSRPYDLVRHQDTIHRSKKQDYKCDVCQEQGQEKIFSRNDALVRHMRHVHKIEVPKGRHSGASAANVSGGSPNNGGASGPSSPGPGAGQSNGPAMPTNGDIPQLQSKPGYAGQVPEPIPQPMLQGGMPQNYMLPQQGMPGMHAPNMPPPYAHNMNMQQQQPQQMQSNFGIDPSLQAAVAAVAPAMAIQPGLGASTGTGIAMPYAQPGYTPSFNPVGQAISAALAGQPQQLQSLAAQASRQMHNGNGRSSPQQTQHAQQNRQQVASASPAASTQSRAAQSTAAQKVSPAAAPRPTGSAQSASKATSPRASTTATAPTTQAASSTSGAAPIAKTPLDPQVSAQLRDLPLAAIGADFGVGMPLPAAVGLPANVQASSNPQQAVQSGPGSAAGASVRTSPKTAAATTTATTTPGVQQAAALASLPAQTPATAAVAALQSQLQSQPQSQSQSQPQSQSSVTAANVKSNDPATAAPAPAAPPAGATTTTTTAAAVAGKPEAGSAVPATSAT